MAKRNSPPEVHDFILLYELHSACIIAFIRYDVRIYRGSLRWATSRGERYYLDGLRTSERNPRGGEVYIMELKVYSHTEEK